MDDFDRSLAQRALKVLDLEHPVVIQEGLGGGSGARVFGVDVGRSAAVLKVTAEESWRAAALRELSVHVNPALDGFRPALLASGHDDELVVLLTERGEPLPAAPTEAEWSTIAHRLGQLHRAAPSNAPAALPQGETALEAWRQAGADVSAELLTSRLEAARSISSAAAPVLNHGDCHLDNLVLIDGKPYWIDWQQAHPGPGFDDLVFCWQRAEFAGLEPPRDAMSLAYAAGREIAADQALRSQLAAAELQLLVLAWPPYLAYGDDAARLRMIRRLHALLRDRAWTRGSRAA